MRTRLFVGVVALLSVGAPAWAAPVSGTCKITHMANLILAPIDSSFGVIGAGSTNPNVNVSFNVAVDTAAGTITFDGASVTIPPYQNSFTFPPNDSFQFAATTFSGTLDKAGNVVVPDVRFTECSVGGGIGTVCVPSNLCSNDLTRICIKGASGAHGCTGGGVCQGVCLNDPTQTCADDSGCPGSQCGLGTAVPYDQTLTTGTSHLGDVTVTGAPLDFSTGSLTLVFVDDTPDESPIIGSSGIGGLTLTCTLDPIPTAASLPVPATAWAIKLGRVKRGPTTDTADDTLRITGTFTPPSGGADFSADDLLLALATESATVLTLIVPKGTLKANARQTVFSVQDASGQIKLNPALDTTPTHTLSLRKKGTKLLVKLVSKGLELTALTGSKVVSTLTLDVQSASSSRTAKTTPKGLKF